MFMTGAREGRSDEGGIAKERRGNATHSIHYMRFMHICNTCICMYNILFFESCILYIYCIMTCIINMLLRVMYCTLQYT